MSIANRFMLVAILFVITGMCLGIWMGISGPETFNFAPVHAHINLVGWASLFLIGLYYRGAPEAARGILPEIHFWVAFVGAVLLVLGILGAVMPNPSLEIVVVPGSLLVLGGMVLFLIIFLKARG